MASPDQDHHRAHPRWRGEHGTTRRNSLPRSGSSPLARGARCHQCSSDRPHGLIPAGAGSTRTSGRRPALVWAHPRWRGEHGARERKKPWVCGSSPLARGAQDRRAAHYLEDGLIPAGAGSTPDHLRQRRLLEAHPRWRGEHRSCFSSKCLCPGSSPLARGARPANTLLYCHLGLIPAGAGSTLPAQKIHIPFRAHPRWRGEHAPGRQAKVYLLGSSPLARGALVSGDASSGVMRLIPAGAGSTLTHIGLPCGGQAHPRWRGEHLEVLASDGGCFGSSPLARGAHSLSCGSLSRKADSSSTCFPLDHRRHRSRAAGNPLIAAVPCSNHVAVANPPYYLAA